MNWQLSFVCLSFVMGGVVVCWIFVPVRRLLWGGLVVVFVGGLLSSAAMLAFKAHQHSIPKAIILVDEAIGRSGARARDFFTGVCTSRRHEGRD